MKRQEAKILGLKTYTTGLPCKNGHMAHRYTESGSCSECINGRRKITDPKTFLESANNVRLTALTAYNEGLKAVTERYEAALAKAVELEQAAKQHEELLKEAEQKESIRILAVAKQKIDIERAQVRKAALKRMVKVNVLIQPHDVVNAKAWLLEKAQSVCPELTMDDINYRNKVQGGVLYEIKCFPEHMNEVVAETNRVYNSDTSTTSGVVTPQ